MKTSTIFSTLLLALSVAACNKAADSAGTISLTPSTTTAITGQTVAVTVASNVNATKWTVTPSTAKSTYAITTAKVNYFTFTQPGTYTVSVSAKAIAYDPTANQSLDSCWQHTGRRSACIKGVDSASTKITVTN
jgi:plastocyanin